MKTFLLCLVSVAPFVFFQYFSYYIFCKTSVQNIPNRLIDYANIRGYYLPGKSKFCSKFQLPYSYVQKNHWNNVGFLRYYEFKQIPNFILAFPIIFLVFTCLFFYFKSLKGKTIRDISKSPLLSYSIHCLALTCFATLFMHIQVRKYRILT